MPVVQHFPHDHQAGDDGASIGHDGPWRIVVAQPRENLTLTLIFPSFLPAARPRPHKFIASCVWFAASAEPSLQSPTSLAGHLQAMDARAVANWSWIRDAKHSGLSIASQSP